MSPFKSQFRYTLLLLVFFSAAASSQSLPSIKGIRIISTSINLSTGEQEITFINDSIANITAYEITSLNVHPDGSASRSTMPKDLFDPEWQSQLKHRPFLPETPPTGNLIHPGESVTLKWIELGGKTPSSEISNAVIGIDVAIYSNGTAESLNPAQLAAFLTARQQQAHEYATIAEIGRRVLTSAEEGNALTSMRDNLAVEEKSGHLNSSRASSEFSRILLPNAAENFTGNLLESVVREHRMKGDSNQKSILIDFITDMDNLAVAWRKSAEIEVVNR